MVLDGNSLVQRASTAVVFTGTRPFGGVLIVVVSLTPDRDIWSVRGIGVAERVRTSTPEDITFRRCDKGSDLRRETFFVSGPCVNLLC